VDALKNDECARLPLRRLGDSVVIMMAHAERMDPFDRTTTIRLLRALSWLLRARHRRPDEDNTAATLLDRLCVRLDDVDREQAWW
jgi:hypothetical protein